MARTIVRLVQRPRREALVGTSAHLVRAAAIAVPAIAAAWLWRRAAAR